MATAPPSQPSQARLVILGFVVLLLISIIISPSRPALPHVGSAPKSSYQRSESQDRVHLALPSTIEKLHINIGPNTSPLTPPNDDPTTGVLAVEANLGVANHLREMLQKQRYSFRFFVINCAIAGPPLAGGLSTFHYYNSNGGSSSLAPAKKDERGHTAGFANRTTHDPSDKFGPGPSGLDFVPVLSLEALLRAIPANVSVPYLMTDTQGFDLAVIKSASRETLRRVQRLKTETYLEGVERKRYEGVQNDLKRDWIPYMKSVGYSLDNPTDEIGKEYDAFWTRID